MRHLNLAQPQTSATEDLYFYDDVRACLRWLKRRNMAKSAKEAEMTVAKNYALLVKLLPIDKLL